MGVKAWLWVVHRPGSRGGGQAADRASSSTVSPAQSDALQRIAAAQAGLFTRQQAQRCGFSNYQIRRRVRTGEWRHVLGPVLARAGQAVTPLMRDHAATLARPDAVLCGPSAARRYGIEVPDTRTWLLVAPGNRLRLAGADVRVRVRRERLPERDLTIVDGVLVTTRERAVFDCLRILPEADATGLLDRALQRRWIDLVSLASRVHGFAGRPGINNLVRLLRDATPGARSTAERQLHGHLRRARMTGWHANEPILDADGDLIGTGDVVFRDVRLVIEVDGRAWHSSDDRFQYDRDRQNRLVATGWTVLRFTWADLTGRPAYVVDTIRAVRAELATRTAG
jgi:very-short-patch-repair endonuclease